MQLDSVASLRVLVMRAGSRVCALPSQHVVETMRPLGVTALAGAPPSVLGVALIRGAPTPVVDVGVLLGATDARPGRFVTIRVGERIIALAVTSVVGLRLHDRDSLPPLAQHALGGALEALTRLDAELVLVLAAARMVPDEVWEAVCR
jgi:purine-binding chemotaxis protein CheW